MDVADIYSLLDSYAHEKAKKRPDRDELIYILQQLDGAVNLIGHRILDDEVLISRIYQISPDIVEDHFPKVFTRYTAVKEHGKSAIAQVLSIEVKETEVILKTQSSTSVVEMTKSLELSPSHMPLVNITDIPTLVKPVEVAEEATDETAYTLDALEDCAKAVSSAYVWEYTTPTETYIHPTARDKAPIDDIKHVGVLHEQDILELPELECNGYVIVTHPGAGGRYTHRHLRDVIDMRYVRVSYPKAAITLLVDKGYIVVITDPYLALGMKRVVVYRTSDWFKRVYKSTLGFGTRRVCETLATWTALFRATVPLTYQYDVYHWLTSRSLLNAVLRD